MSIYLQLYEGLIKDMNNLSYYMIRHQTFYTRGLLYLGFRDLTLLTEKKTRDLRGTTPTEVSSPVAHIAIL